MDNSSYASSQLKMRTALSLWRDIIVRGLQNNAYDLSTRQTGVLLCVYLGDSAPTIKSLSDKLLLPKSTICRAVDTLIRFGLVKRKRDLVDTRLVYIHRTVKGSVYLSEFAEIINTVSNNNDLLTVSV